MKGILISITFFFGIIANAQNYFISFLGDGLSTSVSTVKVENLTTGTSLTLDGSDILSLSGITEVYQMEYDQSYELKIYPNPMTSCGTFEISPPFEGDAVITVLDMNGKPLTTISSYLVNGRQDFRLSGIKNGLYFINVKGNGYQFSGKLISLGNSNGSISIEKVNNNTHTGKGYTKEIDSKGVHYIVEMVYSPGDILKYTGISGIYCVIITDIPSSSKTISFNFIDCTDGDNNHYSIVEIGGQVWMAENLKTRRYNDLTSIPLVSEKYTDQTSGYCWYGNDELSYKNTYGALYNWYSINSGKLCPIGWHIPSDSEFTTLTNFLGGESISAGKLKEKGNLHWASPNNDASNETGFSAMPGGYTANGGFHDIGYAGFWWSSTEVVQSSPPTAYCRSMAFFNGNVTRSNPYSWDFLSVRCIKNGDR